MKLRWLSQAGFLLQSQEMKIAIDPYLSDDLAKLQHYRMTPPPISPSELNPDTVIFSHDHLDHYDPVTIAEILRARPDCKLIGVKSVCRHHENLGFDVSSFSTIKENDTISLGGLKITAVRAYHSEPCAIGFFISTGKSDIYISADTLYRPTLAKEILAVSGRKPNLAIVCINGKLGNMPWRDAARLVLELGATSAMPMHYGLFADNTEDPHPFKEFLSEFGIDVVIPDESSIYEL